MKVDVWNEARNTADQFNSKVEQKMGAIYDQTMADLTMLKTRVNDITIWDEVVKYLDFMCLYPSVSKYGTYPVGSPRFM